MNPAPEPKLAEANSSVRHASAIAAVNLALNRPARQSSVSQWSYSELPDEAARTGNNGVLTLPYGCHTSNEYRPWWQVDLGVETAIDKIVIYNRQECAYRLRYFSLYASPDGKQWEHFYKRTEQTIFGELADDPFVLVPKNTVLARFVRLQLDYRETLHFREFEVYGHPPTPEERQKFSIKVDRDSREHDFTSGRTGFITELDAHAIFVDPESYSAKIVAALQKGTYEHEEREFAEKMLRPSDRVLEVGTAIGAVTMVAAARTSPEQVRTFDGNPYIVKDAKRNFEFNQLSGIDATVGILKNRKHLKPSEKTVKFTVLRDFWASRVGVMKSKQNVIAVVDVPVFCLEDEIAAHRANVLIIDIEGGEVELLNDADLSSIRLIIMETHYWAAGVDATDEMLRQLFYQGFNINVELSRWGVIVLRRELDWFKRVIPAKSRSLGRAMRKLFSRIG